MRTLTQQLSMYASYHRDRRNIATHFVGVPLIVVAVLAALARPAVHVAHLPLSPALLLLAGGIGFYLQLDLRFGLAMTAVTTPAFLLAAWIAGSSTVTWLITSSVLFVSGWTIQFVGHAFEGRKPAFVDDLIGLLIGPLFLVAETAFALGLRAELRDAVHAHVGAVDARGAERPVQTAG
jgi:uncharacterized membrane protein YGL010W